MKVKERISIRRFKHGVPAKEHERPRIPLRMELKTECLVKGWPTVIPNKRSFISKGEP